MRIEKWGVWGREVRKNAERMQIISKGGACSTGEGRGIKSKIIEKGVGKKQFPGCVLLERGMNYTIKVNKVRATSEESRVKGFATVVFGNSFKVSNIAILENREKEQLFVSMPRFRSNEVDERGMPIFKDICHPITAEFREELYTAILNAYEQLIQRNFSEREKADKVAEYAPPEFTVSVTPYEREGSNLKGFARIYLEDCFVINNVNILQGKEKNFIAMPSFKTNQRDRNGKDIYQDLCYPVTKEFRARLYDEIEKSYEEALTTQEVQRQEEREQGRQEQRTGVGNNSMTDEDGFLMVSGEPLPFR